MRSMTGYSQLHVQKGNQTLQVILRSLNFKYLDIAVHNLSRENLILEEKIKKEIKKQVRRGKVEVYIFFQGQVEGNLFIDEKVVGKYIAQLHRLAKKYRLKEDISLKDLVHLPQVVQWQEKKSGNESFVIAGVQEALTKLVQFKTKEGRIIERQIKDNLKKLAINAQKINEYKPHVVPEERSKEDIDEEASLFSFYVGKLGALIQNQKEHEKGKTIDFLTQEILRELNAASSKTRKKELAEIIVESKTYIERIREQAQNIE